MGVYLEPNNVSGRELAVKLDVAPSTLSRILKGLSRVTPEMALRLSKALGRSPESWLAMQDSYDLWMARQNVNLYGWPSSRCRRHNFKDSSKKKPERNVALSLLGFHRPASWRENSHPFPSLTPCLPARPRHNSRSCPPQYKKPNTHKGMVLPRPTSWPSRTTKASSTPWTWAAPFFLPPISKVY